jgi:hypothetical protein
VFEQMIAEEIIMNSRNRHRDDDCIDPDMKPVQFKSSLADRFFPALGDAMISIGLRLKYHSHNTLSAEQSQAPNFLIML